MDSQDLKTKLLEIISQFKESAIIRKVVKFKEESSTRINLNYLLISNLVNSLDLSGELAVYAEDDDAGGSLSRFDKIDASTDDENTIIVTGKHRHRPAQLVVLFNDKFDCGTVKDLSARNFAKLTEAGNNNEDLSRKFALSKAVYSVLQKRRTRELVESELLESQVGISIQYSHVRLEGIKRYLIDSGFSHVEITHELIEHSNLSPLCTHTINDKLDVPPKLAQLINHMTQFNQHRISGLEEPSVFINYTAMLARMVSSLYYHFRVKNEEENIQTARWIVLGLAKRMLYIAISVTGLVPMEIV